MNYLDKLVENFNTKIDLNRTDDAIEEFNANSQMLSEAEYNKANRHLKIEILDIDRFVKVNECQQITNPVFYSRDNIPTDDGFLSNKIFGITKDDRAGIFAYIDLGGIYLDPSCYKNWCKIDSKIKAVVNKTDKFIINGKGELESNPAGKNGIKFLKDNIDKIVFKSSESVKRDLKVQYLDANRKKMFITKYLVIPPYYRDSNTGSKSVGVGGINKLYSQLLISIESLKTPQEYGFDVSGAQTARVQEQILCIYDWAAGNTNASLTVDPGTGLGGKLGIIRQANRGKTSNYAARLVMVGSELKVNRPDEMKVNLDRSAIPLAALLACFKPFIQFNVKRFFENEFMGTEQYPVMDKNGKLSYEIPKDPLIIFSDDRIQDEMEKFINTKNDRFVPILVPVQSGKSVYMNFKGRFNQAVDSSIIHRRLTWCDIFYMATVDAVKERMVLITRYPVDTRFNQITTHVIVSSTLLTEPVYVNGNYYPYYPKITESDIGENTGNKFVDTVNLSNLYLEGLCGDYDGDTVSVRGVFTDEANEELKKFIDNKANFIDLNGKNIRVNSKNTIQSLYEITKVLESDKNRLTMPVFN